MKSGIIFLLCLLLGPLASAAPGAYLEMGEGFFDRPTLVVDGTSYTAGGWDGTFKMKEAFKSHPQALHYAKLHERAALQAQLGLWGGLGVALVYLFATPRENFIPTVYWGVFSVGAIYSIYNAKLSQSYAYKAINAYNGVYLTKPMSSLDVQPRIVPSEQRLSLNLIDFSF